MQVFYAPDISGDAFILDEKESRHIVRVLRMTSGSSVRLIDGKGNLYDGIIEAADPKGCRIGIRDVQKDFEKRCYHLHIAISPLKNTDRFEWFIEKSVEMGVDRITPLICRNSEKTTVKSVRIENLIISAMKQSLKALKTVLDEPVRFSEILLQKESGSNLIAHCNSYFLRKKISEVCEPCDKVLILIGPEGDFTTEEITEAERAGFTGVHLGKSRLRSETAGLAACHSVYFINQ